MGKVDNRRAATMRKRLGDASPLVENDQYLPMFRNRQINYQNEFDFSVAEAAKKRNPSAWFAKVWRVEAVAKTVIILRKMMNSVKCKAIELARKAKTLADSRRAIKETSPSGRQKYEEMRRFVLNC